MGKSGGLQNRRHEVRSLAPLPISDGKRVEIHFTIAADLLHEEFGPGLVLEQVESEIQAWLAENPKPAN